MRWSRTRRSLASFRDWAQDTRLYPAGRPLTAGGRPDDLVYDINPVYLETGQGGVSPMRGFGAVLFLLGIYGSCLGLYGSVNGISEARRVGDLTTFVLLSNIATFVMSVPVLAFASFMLVAPFVVAADPIVRFDYKRQKVWMWTGSQGVLELPWSSLVPCVSQAVASAVSTVHVHRGLFAELGADGLPILTGKIPHVVQCGGVSATADGVLQNLEFVRRFMATGDADLPKGRLLARRPKWWAMINFFGVAQAWIEWRSDRDRPGVSPAPWGRTIFGILGFPILFPLQITNWLALALAPAAKWPPSVLALHEADLKDLARGHPMPPAEAHIGTGRRELR